MKEHMVITIMANVGFNAPYTTYVSPAGDCNFSGTLQHGDIRWCLFNTFPSTSISHGPVTSFINVRLILLLVWRSISHSGTLVLVALSTNFIGYGLAGLTRRFLVYPSRAVWPASLATIALNVSDSNHHFRRYALIPLILAACLSHGDKPTVHGRNISRMRWFMYCFGVMFVYFWFPNYIIQATSYFIG